MSDAAQYNDTLREEQYYTLQRILIRAVAIWYGCYDLKRFKNTIMNDYTKKKKILSFYNVKYSRSCSFFFSFCSAAITQRLEIDSHKFG